MTRKPRIHFPGAVYHVITRGNNQETVFNRRKDKLYYLEKLREFSLELFYNLLIYAIMDNHSHLVMQVGETPLSRIMHHLQQAYAIYYNREYERSGHVFENRYKAYLCDSDRYLLALLRYIHLNPVAANITADLEYPWSSHACYAGKRKDNLVDTSLVYSVILQGANSDPAAEYLRFMERSTADLLAPRYLSSLPEQNPGTALADDDISALINHIATAYRINREQLFSKSRAHACTAARKELILTLHYKHHWTVKHIARLINTSSSYVSKVVTDNARPS